MFPHRFPIVCARLVVLVISTLNLAPSLAWGQINCDYSANHTQHRKLEKQFEVTIKVDAYNGTFDSAVLVQDSLRAQIDQGTVLDLKGFQGSDCHLHGSGHEMADFVRRGSVEGTVVAMGFCYSEKFTQTLSPKEWRNLTCENIQACQVKELFTATFTEAAAKDYAVLMKFYGCLL